MSEVVIPQAELDKVTEAVCQGLVASKEVQSNLWGDMQKKFANIEKILATNAEATEVYRKTVDTHMTRNNAFMVRVEPMISSYENAKIIEASDNARGDKIVKWSIRVSAITVLGGAALWIWTKLKGL